MKKGETKEERRFRKMLERNNCKMCEWGKLSGTKYFCMFPRCIKVDQTKGDDGLGINSKL